MKKFYPPLLLGTIIGVVIVATIGITIRKIATPSLNLQELTVTVNQENLQPEISASGTVEPITSVNMSPKNPGRLVELLVEQGDKVEKGQLLAIMENDELKAQEKQAQANLAQANASLEQAKINLPGEIEQAQARLQQAQSTLQQAQARIPREIEQAQAQLNAAEARLELAQERIKRNEYLVSQGTVARDTYDETQNEYRNAQANLIEARQRLEQLQNTKNPEIEQLQANVAEAQQALSAKQNSLNPQISELEAGVEAASAQLELIQVQLQDTMITAPFTGIVTQRYATVGAFVTPTTSASTSVGATSTSILALAQGLEIVAKVPEVDLSQLKIGQSVEIVADAFADQVFLGEIKRIAPEAIVEQNVTSFEVIISLLSGEDLLRSKMNVDVTFIGQQLNNVVVVPTVAIVTQEGKTGVMVVGENNQPLFKPVTIGLTLEAKTQILQGLNPGERVFIDLPENPQIESD